MPTRSPTRASQAAHATVALAVAALALAAAPARAADTTVFRCADGDGGVVYTDVSCRNAEPVELHPGDAAPGAAQRLAAAQAELDAGMQARRAADALAAAQRASAAIVPIAPYAALPDSQTPYDDIGYWPVYVPLGRHDAQKSHKRPPPHFASVRSIVPAGKPRPPRPAPTPMPMPR